MPYSVTFLTMAVAFGVSALVSVVLSPLTQKLANTWGALDIPGGRKKHAKPTALLGGLGIGLSILFCLFISWNMGWLAGMIRFEQLLGIGVAICILAIGGVIDDIHPLPARIQILFPSFAAISVIAGGTGFIQVTNIFGKGGLSLVWFQWSALSVPADLLTFVWLLVATWCY
jgi:UDP-GlcNAc:undecaprenyl-phosphate GlcNAc-1-phosphate transferase